MHILTIKTGAPCEFIDITGQIQAILRQEKIREGVCHIFVAHTTAAVTINENADPDVPRDIITILDRLIPREGRYRHGEGNAAAHAKASLVGASETVLIENGRLALGTWQGIFFCEFDGPRLRKVFVKPIAAA
ncbi:MAG TPA: secondary thiamine-phosphate synthase enzyme YjbQ [Syntrophales bacterium]|jgi:secondary thiamine-phosphate synthase enzyme|nr:secondary thiamine-phosphate synthase enzyme YjbQ [Syntrophales bacterium]